MFVWPKQLEPSVDGPSVASLPPLASRRAGSSSPNSWLHPLTSSKRTANRPTCSGYYDLRDDEVIVFEPKRIEEDHFLHRFVVVVDGLDFRLDEILGVEHSLLEQNHIVVFVFVHGTVEKCTRRASG